jgi:hypothetical protein
MMHLTDQASVTLDDCVITQADIAIYLEKKSKAVVKQWWVDLKSRGWI